MINQTSDQINSVINNLADKIKVPVGELMPALISQAKIDSMSVIIITAILSIAFYFVIKYFCKHFKDYKSKDSDVRNEELHFLICLAFIVFIIGYAIWILNLFFTIDIVLAGFFNPKYWVIHNIFSLLKG